jgi:hypothetical protein
MTSTSTHEPHAFTSRESTSNSAMDEAEVDSIHEETEMRSLPPTDHGRDAYLVLAGCTIIQAPVWGTQLLLN